jgi:hypothetical protein
MILYAILAGSLGCIVSTASYLAGYERHRRKPCTCPPVVLEPRADDWRPATAAEYGARRAMQEITWSEIDQLGAIAEATFGHTWERKLP